MECITCKHEMTHLTEDLYQCDECELVSSSIAPDLSIYDRSYEIKYDRYERTAAGSCIQNLRAECVWRHVFAGAWIKSPRLLDFGCGVGSFLKSLPYDKKMKCNGFDINPYTQYCDVSVLLENYDIVTFWDSLEHLKDPKKIIMGLNPRYIFVCTPSTDDIFAYNSFTQWRHYMPQEHSHYFNEESLCRLIKSCGYDILEVNYDESVPRNGGGAKNILTVAAKRTGHGTH